MSRKKKASRRDRALAEHQAREQRLKRMRTIAGFLGLVPLAGSLACDSGLLLFCIPWSWYMAVWAAVFGCLLYTSPSPRDLSTSRMPSSA